MLFLMLERHKDKRQMRTTVTLDDELVARAQDYTGVQEKSALLREALKALVEREAARRLIRLGGTMPDLKVPPRRRPKLR
jgi:Arc/MetJ family transcription regulator